MAARNGTCCDVAARRKRSVVLDVRMGIYIAIALLFAFLMTYALAPAVRRLAVRVGALDIPSDERRIHKWPIPTTGGLAIFLSFALGAIAFVPMNSSYVGLLLGAFMITCAGFLDDVYNLSPAQKLLVQTGAALLVAFSGVLIEKIAWFDTFIYFGDWSIPITVLWIVTITNAINLIDGLDGLACGISAISSISLLIVSLLSIHDSAVILVTALLAGSCLGFLPYNRHPAQMFMGDAGAMFLGFVLAVISIQGFFKVNAMIAFVAPFLVLGVPILDTLFAFVRRILRGQHPFHADREHFHHRLLDMGLNQSQAVALLYAVSALLGISAILLAEGRRAAGALVMLISLAVGIIDLTVLRRPHPTDGAQRTTDDSPADRKDEIKL